VKIDIEGAEIPVLRDLLRLPSLQFVVFEGDRNKESLFETFTSGGFQVFGIAKTLRIPVVERVSSMRNWSKFHDFVAVPAPRVALAPDRMRLTALARCVR
jgi:hypothetical protein